MRVENYLIDKGIKASLKGFECLEVGIKLVKKDKTYLRGITKRLYPDIAKVLNDTPTRVERAIRHSIEISGNNLTNSEFIARAVIELRSKYGI